MTLKEAMIYRGENESTLALMLATRPLDVRRWCKPGGLEKLSAQRMQHGCSSWPRRWTAGC